MPRYFFRLEKSTVSAIPRAFQLALASLATTTGVKSAAYSMGRWRFTESLLHGGPQLGGWRTAQIWQAILTAFTLSPQAYTLNQLRYDLRKMKGHGLLE